VRAQGRLESVEEFGKIVLRANPDGSIVRVSDVARIELGAQTYSQQGGSTASRLRSSPSTRCLAPMPSTQRTAPRS
jgi:multidrug efflux pump subunit AcrB